MSKIASGPGLMVLMRILCCFRWY